MKEYVWYVCYGSNISSDRFKLYMDKSLDNGSIVKEHKYMIDYKLYFGRWSKKWGGGVCYLDDNNVKENQTYAKMYLISKRQFLDLVAMENGYKSGEVDFELDFKNELVVEGLTHYDKIIKLGEYEGYDKMTFTSSEIKVHNAPSESYIETIAKGLIETFAMTKEESYKYLKSNI